VLPSLTLPHKGEGPPTTARVREPVAQIGK